MTPSTTEQRITPEQLLAMPDNTTLELVNGQLVEKNVSARSSRVEARIIAAIEAHQTADPAAAVYASSLGYRCFADDPDKVRKPDVSVIRPERLRDLSDPDPGFMPIAPDLAVEVVSVHDTVHDVDAKIAEYHGAGFPLVWIADPTLRTVPVHPRSGRPFILTAEDEITAEGALPSFRCRVAEFFPAAD